MLRARLRSVRYLLLFGMSMLISSCVTPVFEGAEVRKGFHGSVGITGGYHCFNDDGWGEWGGAWVKTRGVVGSAGLSHGLSDNVGWFVQSSFYLVSCNDDYSASGRDFNFFPDLTLGLKYEFTRASSPVVFSLLGGSSFPAILKFRPMLGIRHNKQEIFAVGMHFTAAGLYFPIDFFATVRPSGGKGFTFYVGHQTMWLFEKLKRDSDTNHTPANIALGIGYQL